MNGERPCFASQDLRPQGALGQCVDLIWVARGYRHQAEQSLPNAQVGLTIKLGRAARGQEDDCLLRGIQTQPMTLPGASPIDVVGVQFRAQGAYRLFGLPMHEIADSQISLEQLLGTQAAQWRDQLEQARDLAQRLRIMEALLSQRLKHDPDPLLDRSLAVLAEFQRNARISELLQAEGVSNKRLIRLFRERIGLTPKRFTRLIRLQHVLTQLTVHSPGSKAPKSMVDIALQQGFCDQAHMVREFRLLTGVTPSRYAPLYAGNLHHVPTKPAR